jgi:U1 small nuclear ribonucleoprotein 70kDa
MTGTDKLPPALLGLFLPRPQLRYTEPCDHAPEDRRTAVPEGVGAYLQALKEYKDTDNYVPTESWLQRRDRIKQEKKAATIKLLTVDAKECKCKYISPASFVMLTAYYS